MTKRLFFLFIVLSMIITGSIFSNDTKELNIAFTGDLGLGTNFGRKNNFYNEFQAKDNSYFLSGMKEYFDKADIVIANLENVFTEKEEYQKNKVYTYKAYDMDYIKVLKAGGITHVNVINNHMVDYLQAGFDDTLKLLDEYGIKYFGTNEAYTTNHEVGNIRVEKIETFESNGIKVGLLGYFGYYSSYVSDERLKKDISYLKNTENVDFIIVSMHWGGQNTQDLSGKQVELGRKIIDFGADMVYGHHPHVLQKIETYKGKKIYYSVGNFLFIDYGAPKDPDSIIIDLTLQKDSENNIKAIYKNIPILWCGSTSRNLYRPVVTENPDIIARIKRKLQIKGL